MKKITFDVLPHGPCLTCLESMIDPELGRPAIYREIVPDHGAWGIYCEHNQVGAYAFVYPGQAVMWTMFVPIDSLAFVAMFEKACNAAAQVLTRGSNDKSHRPRGGS